MPKRQLNGVRAARRFTASTTVRAHLLFTLPVVIVQPLSGAWLVWRGDFNPTDHGLAATCGLYLLAGACWLPTIAIQIRIKRMLCAEAMGKSIDPTALSRPSRSWFALGWPAFGGQIVVFDPMVAKPSW